MSSWLIIKFMRKKIIKAVAMLLLLHHTQAQNNQIPGKWKFSSINQLGLLNGAGGTAFHAQSVNGFQHKQLFAGVGVGLDYYRYRSIPVFAELRNYFGKSPDRFFMYADGGAHFVWAKNGDQDIFKAKYRPGFYSNIGIGYQAVFKNGEGLSLSAGYSYKKVKYSQNEYTFCPFDGPCTINSENYTYDLNRLILQIGWMF